MAVLVDLYVDGHAQNDATTDLQRKGEREGTSGEREGTALSEIGGLCRVFPRGFDVLRQLLAFPWLQTLLTLTLILAHRGRLAVVRPCCQDSAHC